MITNLCTIFVDMSCAVISEDMVCMSDADGEYYYTKAVIVTSLNFII